MTGTSPQRQSASTDADVVSLPAGAIGHIAESTGVSAVWRRARPLMLSVENWPEPAVRAWKLAQRFQKFLIVGAVGLAVNQGLLFLFHDVFHLRLGISSPAAIFLSMVVTFTLNERWTWHDRGTGPVLHRMGMYFPINTVGLLINFGVLSLLVHRFGVHYLMANLVGAGLAAIWNFLVNHHVTWRE